MLRNLFKTAFRNMLRRRGFSLLNIAGLALGMAAFLLIFRYVAFELSYEDFHPDRERVFFLGLKNEKSTGENNYNQLPPALKPVLERLPEVQAVARFEQVDYQNNSLIVEENGEKRVYEDQGMYFADAGFYEVLGFPLKEGSQQALKEPWQIVLSAEAAQTLFPDGDALGRSMKVSGNTGDYDYTVAGVLEPFPANTHFYCAALFSYPSMFVLENEDPDTRWTGWDSNLFLKTSPGTKPGQLEEKIIATSAGQPVFAESEGRWSASLLNISDLHFSDTSLGLIKKRGDRQVVMVLVSTGLLILLIAWINYINLSTARAMERAREVGVRKVLGASKGRLQAQFLTESLLLNCVAVFLALVAVQLLLPVLQPFTNPMHVSAEQQPYFVAAIAGIILIGSLLSGLYPAFVLSGYRPLVVVNGRLHTRKSGALLRKTLVVVQYAASFVLLAGAITIHRQIDFMQDKNLGMDISDLLIVNAPPGSLAGNNYAFFDKVDAFKAELTGYPSVEAITTSSAVPGKEIGWGSNAIKRPGDASETAPMISLVACDKDYRQTFGLEMLSGRFYQPADDSFEKGDMIINEKAAEVLGFSSAEEATGQKLEGGGMFPEITVRGVVKNHHHYSLKEAYQPIFYVKSAWSNFYSVKMNLLKDLSAQQQAKMLEHTLADIRQVWERFFPDAPFDYFFADDAFNAQYQADRNFRRIINLFTLVAVIIATLGLMGLSSYNLVQRRKEMGVRKVLGATSGQLLVLVSQGYLYPLLLASLLGLPLAWQLLEAWLGNYAFRIELGAWLGVAPLAIILLVASLTVGTQTLLTVQANPVDALKDE